MMCLRPLEIDHGPDDSCHGLRPPTLRDVSPMATRTMTQSARRAPLALVLLCTAGLVLAPWRLPRNRPQKARPPSMVRASPLRIPSRRTGLRMAAPTASSASARSPGSTTATCRASGSPGPTRPDTKRGLQATPIVIDGVMYTTGVWSVVYALNAKTRPGTVEVRPVVPREWGPTPAATRSTRRRAVEGLAVLRHARRPPDLARRAYRWQALGDGQHDRPHQAYRLPARPRVVKGKVLIGNGGGEYGVRGYLSRTTPRPASSRGASTRCPAIRRTDTKNPELEAAAKTWNASGGPRGGGTVWDSMAYDPELDTL